MSEDLNANGPNWELILHKIEDINKAQANMDKKIDAINLKLGIVDTLSTQVHDIKDWKEKFQEELSVADLKELKEWKKGMDEIISVTQMKEMKDEVYKQKSKWTATIAIISAVQIVMGVLVTLAKLGVF